MRRGASLGVILAAVLAAAAPPAAGQMYKCKNERGATQYSDKPCADGHQGGEVEIRGQPPISGKLAPATEDLKRDERDFQRRQVQRSRQEELEARQLAQAKQRCDSLRQQLARVNATRRPRDASAHEAQLKRLNDEVSKCR